MGRAYDEAINNFGAAFRVSVRRNLYSLRLSTWIDPNSFNGHPFLLHRI